MSDVTIQVIRGLPFISATIHANGQRIQLDRMLLDTGSGGTVVKTDHLIEMGVIPLSTDQLRFLQGVGGDEAVVEKLIDGVQVGAFMAAPFIIQMGAMDYGVAMDGIIGLDFLLRAQVMIDFKTLQIHAAS